MSSKACGSTEIPIFEEIAGEDATDDETGDALEWKVAMETPSDDEPGEDEASDA